MVRHQLVKMKKIILNRLIIKRISIEEFNDLRISDKHLEDYEIQESLFDKLNMECSIQWVHLINVKIFGGYVYLFLEDESKDE